MVPSRRAPSNRNHCEERIWRVVSALCYGAIQKGTHGFRMDTSLQPIPLVRLALVFVPALIVVGISYRWSANGSTSLYAMGRMLVQLLLVGYVLAFIFETDRVSVVFLVLTVMLFAASWIALRPVSEKSKATYAKALASIAAGGVLTLVVVTQVVLDLTPWYQPRFVVPLAGMIFASSMNTVSLAAERFQAERSRDVDYGRARGIAFGASLIPLVNTLFAVGVVSIPGMMTGQILSGVAPLVAARYQIMVMCMIFGASGISAALYLTLVRER